MADLAWVFHWSPAAMRAMTLDELLAWHALALERVQAARGGGGTAGG